MRTQGIYVQCARCEGPENLPRLALVLENCFLPLQCRHTPSSRRAFAPSPAPWHAQLGLSEPLLCASLVHLLPSISLCVSLLLVVPLTPSRTSHLALSPPLHLSFRHRSGFSRRHSSFSILSSVASSLDHLRTAPFLHRLFPSLSLEVFRSFLLVLPVTAPSAIRSTLPCHGLQHTLPCPSPDLRYAHFPLSDPHRHCYQLARIFPRLFRFLVHG